MAKANKLAGLIGTHIIHRSKLPGTFDGNDWTYKTEDRDVILMAVSGKWAMVQRPECVPYVVGVKELISEDQK